MLLAKYTWRCKAHCPGLAVVAALALGGSTAARAFAGAPTPVTARAIVPTLPLAISSAGSQDKKAAYLTAKRSDDATSRQPRAKRASARRSDTRGPAARLVNLHNIWTNEWLAIELPLRGEVTLPPADQLDTFLRCHFTDQTTHMDLRPLRLALAAARHFKVDRVDIVSGYRAPKYNLLLRKKGREVARDSQHTKGTALDMRLPTISPRDLSRWARAQKLGGVGIYRSSGFVHVDTGPIRTWSGQ